MNCQEVVNAALRKIGVLAAGREARATDRADTFEALKNLYRQLINEGSFGRLRDVIPVGDYTAFGMERIFRNASATLTITLPETVRNWTFWGDYGIYGIYPNEPVPPPVNPTNTDVTTPRDLSVVVINDSFLQKTFEFIYDGQQKLWQGLYDLTLSDEAPLSHRDAQGLSALLAAQINDEYGQAIGTATQRLAGQFQSSIVNRFSSPSPPIYGEYY